MLANANTVLVGDNVALVPYQRQHVPQYHLWMTSTELQELTESEPLSLEEEYAMCDSWRNDADKLTFIIVDNARYQLDQNDVEHMVGDVNCFFNNHEDVLDNVELEVMIAEPTARRRGFAKEALRLMMGYCVHELGVKGFRAQILEKNEASRRLFESLGFKFVKAIECFHEVVYALGQDDARWVDVATWWSEHSIRTQYST